MRALKIIYAYITLWAVLNGQTRSQRYNEVPIIAWVSRMHKKRAQLLQTRRIIRWLVWLSGDSECLLDWCVLGIHHQRLHWCADFGKARRSVREISRTAANYFGLDSVHALGDSTNCNHHVVITIEGVSIYRQVHFHIKTVCSWNIEPQKSSVLVAPCTRDHNYRLSKRTN